MTDQRGVPRTQGGSVDIGAVESGPATIVVTTLADENDGGINLSYAPGTSLRDAIAFADADRTPATRSPSPPTWRARSPSAWARCRRSRATSQSPAPRQLLTINGQGTSGILSVQCWQDVTISGLTLADGSAPRRAIVNAGTLTLSESPCRATRPQRRRGHRQRHRRQPHAHLSNDAARSGAAVANYETLSVIGCTLSGDSPTSGGGISNNGRWPPPIAPCMITTPCTAAASTIARTGDTRRLHRSGQLGTRRRRDRELQWQQRNARQHHT